MRVELKIDPHLSDTTAVIYAPQITPQLMALLEAFEGLEGKASLLITKKDGKVFIIEPEQADIIRTEGGEIKLYNRQAQAFTVSKPLHELLEMLPGNFVRISKSAIVNIKRVDHLSNSFDRTMNIVMKNGVKDYISRSYLSEFKKRLGL